MSPFLKISDLHLEYATPQGKVIHALNGASLQIQQGEVFGLLGESGSGKSTVARALLRLLPKNARITGGSIELARRICYVFRRAKWKEFAGRKLPLSGRIPDKR